MRLHAQRADAGRGVADHAVADGDRAGVLLDDGNAVDGLAGRVLLAVVEERARIPLEQVVVRRVRGDAADDGHARVQRRPEVALVDEHAAVGLVLRLGLDADAVLAGRLVVHVSEDHAAAKLGVAVDLRRGDALLLAALEVAGDGIALLVLHVDRDGHFLGRHGAHGVVRPVRHRQRDELARRSPRPS